MKHLCVAVVMALSSMAVAQEIGTEITPVTPGSGTTTQPVNQPNDNPYATQPPQKEGDKPAEKPKAAPVAEGGSAGKGAFGVRATFGGQSVPRTTGTGTALVDSGTVGLSYWATDGFTLLFDLGFGMSVGGSFAMGFGALVGMDYHFRSPGDSLRPLINVQVGLGAPISASIGRGMALFGQVGGGAEYFFTPSFSLTGRIGLGFNLGFDNGTFTLTTITPAVGAAWYF